MITAGREHLSANEFRDALLTTPPGGTFVYFTGLLSADLHQAALDKAPTLAELALVARMALEAPTVASSCSLKSESMTAGSSTA
jgi:hypothetical protein